jgi:hypothetical protein
MNPIAFAASAISNLVRSRWLVGLLYFALYLGLLAIRAIMPDNAPAFSTPRPFADLVKQLHFPSDNKTPVIRGKLFLVTGDGDVSGVQGKLPTVLRAAKLTEVGTIGKVVASGEYETGWYEVHSGDRERAKTVWVELYDRKTFTPIGQAQVTRTSWGAWMRISDWDVASMLLRVPHTTEVGEPIPNDIGGIEWVNFNIGITAAVLTFIVWFGLYLRQQFVARANRREGRQLYW